MRFFLVTLLAVALVACSSEDESDDKNAAAPTSGATDRVSELPRPALTTTAFGPTCESLFVPGVIMVEEAVDGCLDQPRGKLSPSTVTKCGDGRTLISNPFGFGLIGGEVHPTAGDGPPDAEMSAKLRDIANKCTAG